LVLAADPPGHLAGHRSAGQRGAPPADLRTRRRLRPGRARRRASQPASRDPGQLDVSGRTPAPQLVHHLPVRASGRRSVPTRAPWSGRLMARSGQGPSSGPAPLAVSAGELRVLKETLNPDLTDAELRLFALVAKRSGLDPFARQIYAVKRPTRSGERVTFQTSQEGYLSIAERTGEYDGCDEPTYGPLRAGHPLWATVRVYRKGMTRGVAATAYWDEYHPGDGAGAL